MDKSNLKQKIHIYNDTTMLGHYLAGLWEGDGNVNIKDKNYPKPTIHITLHRQQGPCAKQLLALLSRLCNDPVGSVHIRNDNNSCVLNIHTPQGLQFVVGLIQHKLRTPKAFHLNPIIDWLNRKDPSLNFTPISSVSDFNLSTPWFAGFCDADGSFGIDLSYKGRLKVSCQFQINQRMIDPRSGLSYHKLFCSIANALEVRLHVITETRSRRAYFAIKATSNKSKDILRRYFDLYPLLTSKFLDYKSWCDADNLVRDKKKNRATYLEQIQFLKKGMNQNRYSFTWDHLPHI